MKGNAYKVKIALLVIVPVITFVMFRFMFGHSLSVSLIVTGVVLGLVSIPFIAEELRDRKYSRQNTKEEFERSHERYLRFMENYTYSRPAGSDMESDMKFYFNNIGSRMKFIASLAVLVVLCAVSVLFISMREWGELLMTAVFMCIFGSIMWNALSRLMLLPVKRFVRENAADEAEIRDSYMNSNIVWELSEAVSIGQKYLIMINEHKITAARFEEVENAYLLRERVKNYADGLYAGEDINYYICINIKGKKEPVKVLLGEMKAQAAFDELERLGYTVSKPDISAAMNEKL